MSPFKYSFIFVPIGIEPMATANFYLKEPNSKNYTLIYLFFNYNGKRLKYSTGELINPKNWNNESQRVKKSITGSGEINDCLDKLEEDIKKTYRTLKANNLQITNESLKEGIIKNSSNKSKTEITFFSFTEDFIQSISGLRRKSSIVVYNNVFRTLKEYKKHSQKKIDFDTINLDFYNDYSNYLTKEKKFKPNTIGKHFKTIKTFLNEATERGVNSNLDYQSKKFKVIQEDVDSIYLDESELEKIWKLDLTAKPNLEKVRDLFIIGCYTGLRFSDFTQLRTDNINNDMITITTQKTNSGVTIPVHPKVREVIKKYKNNLPEAFSNQKMNEYLKDIGWNANILDNVQKTEYNEGIRVVKFLKKFELITTHTARRSFATNLFKQGLPAIVIMKITGHKTEKAFMKYIKISNEQNAELLKRFWETNNK
jgi:integrase